MAKFPSQRKMLYQTGALSNDAFTQLASGGVTGDLNLPKDLSLMNRRGYASTTRKGVPLVYQCKIDFYMHDENGRGPSSESDTASGSGMATDLQAVLKVTGCQNNWAMKNAAVKWHAAREEMFRRAGVKKSDRGAYSHEIRYNYDANGDAWLVPIDGDGDAFAGGTWDVSTITTDDDDSFSLRLVGTGSDESSAVNAATITIGYSYLASRAQLDTDTNRESSDTPAEFSLLNNLLDDSDLDHATLDNIKVEGQDAQDNPPYDTFVPSDTGNDIIEPVELGRAIAGFGNAYGSVIVEIPFGLAKVVARVHDAADTALTPSALMCVEVLDIYEMQG